MHHRSPTRVVLVGIAAALALTACGGGGEDTGSADPADADSTVTLTGTDGLKFDPTDLEADAGEVAISLTAQDAVEHDVVIEGINGNEPVVAANAGSTNVGTVELEPGTYTFYCNIPGHRQAGMEGTLEVD